MSVLKKAQCVINIKIGNMLKQQQFNTKTAEQQMRTQDRAEKMSLLPYSVKFC
jgi:hypothetical protein